MHIRYMSVPYSTSPSSELLVRSSHVAMKKAYMHPSPSLAPSLTKRAYVYRDTAQSKNRLLSRDSWAFARSDFQLLLERLVLVA